MKKTVLLLVSLVSLVFSTWAGAQSYPTKPIRMIVPFPAGGPADIFGRGLAQGLGDQLGQPVIVENVGGVGGVLGVDRALKSNPDGYTLGFNSGSTLSIAPFSFAKLPYDVKKDVGLITLVVRVPEVLAVHPSLPVNSLAELIAYAKANPGKVNWATQGVAGSSHLVGELFKSLAGVDLFAVHYKGSTPANVDIIAGRADVHFDGSSTSLANIQGKRVKAIAHTGEKRLDSAPELPSFAESGLPGMVVYSWYGIVTPAGTPQSVIGRLNTEMNAFVKTKDVMERMHRDGSEIGEMTPAQFGKMIADETELWRKVLAPLNLKLD